MRFENGLTITAYLNWKMLDILAIAPVLTSL